MSPLAISFKFRHQKYLTFVYNVCFPCAFCALSLGSVHLCTLWSIVIQSEWSDIALTIRTTFHPLNMHFEFEKHMSVLYLGHYICVIRQSQFLPLAMFLVPSWDCPIGPHQKPWWNQDRYDSFFLLVHSNWIL